MLEKCVCIIVMFVLPLFFEVKTVYIYLISEKFASVPFVMFNYLKMVILNATQHQHVLEQRPGRPAVKQGLIFLNITGTPITT